MSPRARARRGEGDRLREEIVEAARRLLLQTGDEEAVTIRAVARAVGVTPPSIYLHFADKQALLLTVCQTTFDELDEHIERAVAGLEDHVAVLRERGKAYVRFGLDKPEHYRILFMTRSTTMQQLSPEELIASAAFDHHLAAVQRACADGAIPPEHDPMLVAVGLWSAVHGITSLLIAKPDFPWPDVDRLVDHVIETQVRGLGVASVREAAGDGR